MKQSKLFIAKFKNEPDFDWCWAEDKQEAVGFLAGNLELPESDIMEVYLVSEALCKDELKEYLYKD